MNAFTTVLNTRPAEKTYQSGESTVAWYLGLIHQQRHVQLHTCHAWPLWARSSPMSSPIPTASTTDTSLTKRRWPMLTVW